MRLSKITLLLLLISMTGCTLNKKYSKAYKAYSDKDFIQATILYDLYIETALNGALATKAELERSESYYQLGLQALNNQNWSLAKDLFYLANSDKADNELDKCYFELAKIALAKNQFDKVEKNYNYIINNLPNSELIPEVLYERIKLLVGLDKKSDAYKDCLTLYEKYPESDFTIKIQSIVDELIPYYIDEALMFKLNDQYQESLEMFLQLTKHPTAHKTRIYEEISSLYIILALSAYKEKRYKDSYNFFQSALEFDVDNTHSIENEIQQICNTIVSQGDTYAEKDSLNEAIETYKIIYNYYPQSEIATSKIAETEQKIQDYAKAAEILKSAEKLANENKFQAALKKYKEVLQLHNTKEVRKQIFEMQNLIRAEKAPLEFARSIITSYRKGKLVENINLLVEKQKELYKDNVHINEWKVLYSFGKYKYEVRYDIITPDKNYYFAWRINLRDQSIFSLNKLSEKILYE